jgi:hypothetical protein
VTKILRAIGHDETASMPKRGGDLSNRQPGSKVRDRREKEPIATLLNELTAHKVSNFVWRDLAA